MRRFRKHGTRQNFVWTFPELQTVHILKCTKVSLKLNTFLNISRRQTCKSVQYFLSYSCFKSHPFFSIILYCNYMLGSPLAYQRSIDRAGCVMVGESKLVHSKVRKLEVAITASEHIFRFQVFENQRKIPYASYCSTSEYYNIFATLRCAQSTIMCLSC
jgi:hypothetical protein